MSTNSFGTNTLRDKIIQSCFVFSWVTIRRKIVTITLKNNVFCNKNYSISFLLILLLAIRAAIIPKIKIVATTINTFDR